MTIVARIVLADCELAVTDLGGLGVGSEWSRRWVALVALLRAVGHVLDKVDGQRSRELRRIVHDEYRKLKDSKPEPHIYWGFIEEERNLVLKEYRFRGVHASGLNVTSLTGPSSKGQQFTRTREEPGDLHLHVFDEGPFAGRNHLDVATEAIRWWRSYLDQIDALVERSSS